jgi:conserved oligomeric Golgi complex subunit 6
MATPTTPARSASVYPLSASTSSPGLSTPTRLTSTPSNGAGRGHPLSLRLYKILGARYEDESTREALEILSGMYAPAERCTSAGKSVVIARRIGKAGGAGAESDESEDGTVRTVRTGAKPTTPAADAAGGNDSAARARKNLKRDVEMKMARSSRLFLSAFREVDNVCLFLTTGLALGGDD